MQEINQVQQVEEDKAFIAPNGEKRAIQPAEAAFPDGSTRLSGAGSLSEFFGVPGIQVAESENIVTPTDIASQPENPAQTFDLAAPKEQGEVENFDLAAPSVQSEVQDGVQAVDLAAADVQAEIQANPGQEVSGPTAENPNDQSADVDLATAENTALTGNELTAPISNENNNTKTEEELKELKAAITAKINAILANPEGFTSQQLGELQYDLIELMAGRSYEEFLQQENGSELSIALESLRVKIEQDQERQKENVIQTSELLGIAAPESEEVVDIKAEKIVDVAKEGEETLNITTQDPQTGEQQTISLGHLAALALFVTADMMLFKGNLSYAITSLGDTGTRLARLSGADVSGRMASSEEFSNQLVEVAEPRKFITFLEERRGNEMYKFLAGLSRDNREKLLAGQRFGDLLGKHQLTTEQVEMVTNQLDENQKREFNIKPKE